MPSAQQCGYVLLPVAAWTLATGAVATARPVPAVVGTERPAILADVNRGDLVFSAKRETETRSFLINFPPGKVSQGYKAWYLIRLDASVTFAQNSGRGSLLITGFSRGQAGAQVEFYPDRETQGRPRIRWASVDLIHGQRSGASSGREAKVHYMNYLPYSGVRSGPAPLTFQVERFGNARVAQVKIKSSSGIYATRTGPVELEVAADFPDDAVLEPGKTARLRVVVTNRSTRLARNVNVSVMPQASEMFIKGKAERSIKHLRKTATASFALGRARSGKLRVRALALAPNGAEALTVVEAAVSRNDEDGIPVPAWAALLGAGMGLAGIVALLRHRKQSGGR